MLQLSNLDEGKTDWISETQLIIPMVENEEIQTKEIDGLSKHTITLNTLEGTDQTLFTNANGHTFVIGLERTLFENYSSKSDLLLMSNSDLKLLPSVSDSKLSYSLPPVEQPKNEIVWENSSFEKPLSRDILNVIQETSKGWKELGKSSDICLDDINSVGVHESKISNDFLIEPHLVSQSEKMRNESSEHQYIVGYYPVVETCDAVLVPASLMTLQQKSVDSLQSEKALITENDDINNTKNLNQLFVNEDIEDAQSSKWIKSQTNILTPGSDNFIHDKINNEGRVSILKMNNTPDNSLILMQDNINKLNETVIPLIESSNSDVVETKTKNDITYNEIENCMTKDEKFNGKVLESETTLPEQSLPLKKKAKMKKSPVGGNCMFPHGDNLNNVEKNLNFLEHVKDKTCQKQVTPNAEKNFDDGNSDSDEPLSNHAKRKMESCTYNFKKKKKRFEGNSAVGNEVELAKSNTKRKPKINEQLVEEKGRPYKNITDLLEQLRSDKYINDAIFTILLTGLQEMDVDILKEMYAKQKTKSNEYSSHLKAFALMLHFKQPTAFNHLGKIFQSGWPPLSVIKDWKRRLNNHRRPKAKCTNQ